jgi:flagellar hook assembly protein FlgD
LAIYDARGARVRTLLATRLPAGRHAIVWDGRDAGGSAVASGIYFSRLDVDGIAVEKRLVLLK